MLRELLDRLVELTPAVKVAGTQVRHGMEDVLFLPDGQYIKAPRLMPDRAHEVANLNSFIAAVNHYGNDDESTIWVGDDIVLVIDDHEYRDDAISLVLRYSQPWLAACEVQHLDPKSLRRFLNITLHGCVEQGLGALFGKVCFRSQKTAEVAGSRGRESLGRQVEHEVQGTEDLPERIVAQVPVFETPDYTTRLELFVEPNYDTEKFDVGPMPGQVVTMKNVVLERIAKELAEATNVKVLVGNP